MRDILERTRRAYGPVPPSPQQLEAAWCAIDFEAEHIGQRRPRGHTWMRPLIALAALVVSVSSIAYAAEPAAVKHLIGLDPSRPADRMSVFSDLAVGRAAPSDMGQLMLGDGSRVNSGDPIDTSQLRAVMTWRGDGEVVRMFAAPSRGGAVCLYVERGHLGTLGCSLAMRYNGHVTVGASTNFRTGSLVTGLADDDVVGVRVRLSNGKLVRAHLANNAFLAHVTDPQAQMRGLFVDLEDGTTLDVTMSGCLRSQLVPPRKSHLGCGFGMNQGPHGPL